MMGINLPRPSFSFTFVFSLSIVIIGGSGAKTKPYHRQFLLRRLQPRTTATASDLISLLGTPQQASSVNIHEARQLQSCFKFIVPFSPTQSGPAPLRGGCGKRDEENELVWWPPEAVMELARIAVDSGGDPAAIQRTLDPTIIPRNERGRSVRLCLKSGNLVLIHGLILQILSYSWVLMSILSILVLYSTFLHKLKV